MANTQLYLILFTILNIFLFSNTQYTGSPKKAANFRVSLKQSLELKCEYTGEDGNGQFLGWYKDDELITNDKEEHYNVKNTKKDSKLIIKILESDQHVKKWSVKTTKPGQEDPIQCQYYKISLIPSPQRIETNRETEKLDPEHTSVRRLGNELVQFTCIIVPSPTNPNVTKRIRWQFSVDGKNYSKLPAGVHKINDKEIKIEHVNKTHRGYYRCSLNKFNFTVLLRVKDPLAALLPFICIVSTVLILVIIILIYEKRQRSARKAAAAAAEDETNDNANDPLVKPSNKLSDTENKDHTVKA